MMRLVRMILVLRGMKQPIAFVGLPGSGKSFWAKKLALHLDVKSYDLDELISKEAGLSISKIFDEFGEAAFRKIESDTLKQLLQNPLKENFILALGGGTPAYYKNMSEINQYCTSIYLNVGLDTIIKHITKDETQHRPLAKNVSEQELKTFLTKLLVERDAYYKMSDYMLFQKEISITNFEKIIQDTL